MSPRNGHEASECIPHKGCCACAAPEGVPPYTTWYALYPFNNGYEQCCLVCHEHYWVWPDDPEQAARQDARRKAQLQYWRRHHLPYRLA